MSVYTNTAALTGNSSTDYSSAVTVGNSSSTGGVLNIGPGYSGFVNDVGGLLLDTAYGGSGIAVKGTTTINITNDGAIAVSGPGSPDGVYIAGSYVGTLTNNGTISRTGGTGGDAIRIDATISGSINNSGTLSNNGGIAVDFSGAQSGCIFTNTGTVDGSIELSRYSDVLNINGGIINGDILATSPGHGTVNVAVGIGNTFTATGEIGDPSGQSLAAINLDSGCLVIGDSGFNAGIATIASASTLKFLATQTVDSTITNAGTIEVAAGTVTLQHMVAGSGSVTIDTGGTVDIATGLAPGARVAFQGPSAVLALGAASNFTNHVSGFGAGDSIDFLGLSGTSASINGNNQLVLFNGASEIASVQLTSGVTQSLYVRSDDMGGTMVTASTTAAMITSLASLGGTTGWSSATGINTSGEVCGSSVTSAGLQHAFFDRNGVFTDLGTLGGATSAAAGINSSGTVAGAAATAQGSTHAVIWQNGHIADLGTLGGQTSEALAINDANQVVGDATTAAGAEHAFLWQSGAMTDLGTLGGTISVAEGINSTGEIVGYSLTANGDQHAVAWINGSAIDLGTLGGATSVAYGVNAQGWVVGSSTTATGETHAFLYENGIMTDLGTLGGISSTALAINDGGEIVGYSMTQSDGKHAFQWQNGAMTDLQTLAGPNYFPSSANGLNAKGVIVGSSTTAALATHAFSDDGAMTDLGTLGSAAGLATSINNAGYIVGQSAPAGTGEHATLWHDGTVTDLGDLASTYQSVGGSSIAYAVNSSGQVVGASAFMGSLAHGFLWQNGVLTDLGTLGGTDCWAEGINDAAQVVGYSSLANGTDHAFLWQNGSMTDLGTLDGGSGQSYAYAINNSGQVVGYSANALGMSHAFLWQDGSMTDLGTLGGTTSEATAINASGMVVGDSATSAGAEHAFLWQAGVMTDLGTLGGDSAKAMAVNSGGQVVGESYTANGAEHAFLWCNGRMVDLNGLLPADSGWQLISADGINDNGVVVGQGLYNGVGQAFDLSFEWALSGNQTVSVAWSSYQTNQLYWPVTIEDKAVNVQAGLDAIQVMAASGDISSIVLTDGGIPALTVDPTQLTADLSTLKNISGNFTVDVTASAPNVTIAGLSGHANTAVFSGAASQYAVTPTGDGTSFTVTDVGTGRSSVDHLSNVSALQFSNFADIVASQTPPAAGAVSSAQVTELYSAVFGRTPDVAGLAFYQTYAAAHPSTPFTQFAMWFLSSPEYTGNAAHTYAASTAGDAQFITDCYNNLLHRGPEANAISFYQTKVIEPMLAGLTAGDAAYSQAEFHAHAQVLAYFSQSPEFLSDVTVTGQHPADAQHWLVLI